MSSELQLDVRLRCVPPQSVEAPSGERLQGKAGMVFVAGKTVWSMPERFKVVFTMQGAIQVLGFTFTFTRTIV